MEFKISKDLILELEQHIVNKKRSGVRTPAYDMHHADIAEILTSLILMRQLIFLRYLKKL
jgi:magnesium transporter